MIIFIELWSEVVLWFQHQCRKRLLTFKIEMEIQYEAFNGGSNEIEIDWKNNLYYFYNDILNILCQFIAIEMQFWKGSFYIFRALKNITFLLFVLLNDD